MEPEEGPEPSRTSNLLATAGGINPNASPEDSGNTRPLTGQNLLQLGNIRIEKFPGVRIKSHVFFLPSPRPSNSPADGGCRRRANEFVGVNFFLHEFLLLGATLGNRSQTTVL